jgi:hypothetical protein
LNLKGEVIGINTAIFSQSGGSIGIGFAIPINMVKRVVDQLVDKGKVVRGWLGVSLQPLSPELADSLGVTGKQGAVVASTMPGGPAAAAGLQQNDVILAFDKTPVEDYHHFQRLAAETRAGSKIVLQVLRKIREHSSDEALGVAVCVVSLCIDQIHAAAQEVVRCLVDRELKVAEQEPVAVPVPGARGALRLVVALAEGREEIEAGDAERMDHAVRAAGEHGVGLAAADDLDRFADGLTASSAGRQAVGVGTLSIEQRRQMPGRHVGLLLQFDRGMQPLQAGLGEQRQIELAAG